MKSEGLRGRWTNRRRFLTVIVVVVGAMLLGAGGMFFVQRAWLVPNAARSGETDHGHDEGEERGHEHGDEHGESTNSVSFPKEKWEVAGLRVEPVSRRTLSGRSWVTGRLALNEDRLAHIFSLTDGRVHDVTVQFGDDVSVDQTLAVIDSKEVGATKLDYYRAQLDAEIAKVNYDWASEINTNTQTLIESLSQNPPLESVTDAFADKPMGEYRQQLITAYANLYKSRKDLERLQSLANQGVAAGKQALAAKAAYEADRATFQALLEQIKFTSWQMALIAEQRYRQAEQEVVASRSRLFILGYHEEDLERIDPLREGEAIAHYEIRAPFNGAVIGKNVVLGERVGPDTEMFQIADLSTLWVVADIYQKDLAKLRQLGNELHFRAPNADHEHAAKIFYTGDIFDPETRTIRLRAVVENPERRLKAGMFVEVALPADPIPDALVIPASALSEVEGEDVVFVQVGEERFEMRKIVVGARSGEWIQVREGLKESERVVTAGGFALKSELMKGSISHGH